MDSSKNSNKAPSQRRRARGSRVYFPNTLQREVTNTAAKRLLSRAPTGGIVDDAFGLLKDITPYYRLGEEIAKKPFVRNALNRSTKYLGSVPRDLVRGFYPDLDWSESRAVGKEVKALKAEAKKERTESYIQGPSKSVSYQKTPAIRRVSDGQSHLSGGELFKVLTAPSGGYASGDLMLTVDLNPATIDLPILKSHLKTYEQYHIRKMTISNVGGSGNNATGTFVMVYDPDPMDIWSGGVDLAKRATNAKFKTIARPFDVSHLNVPASAKGTLYVDSEANQSRFESFGHLAIVCLNAIAANTPIGSIYISYELDLFSNQSDPDMTSGDFYARVWSGTTFTTSSALSPSTCSAVSTYSTLSLRPTSEDDYKVGRVRLPAGSYRIAVTIGGGTSCAATSLWAAEQTSTYAPWVDTTYMSAVDSATAFSLDRWVGCLSDFSIKLGLTQGSWTNVQLWISAVTATPYASSMKGLSRIQQLVDASKAEANSAARLKADTADSNKESKEAVERIPTGIVSTNLNSAYFSTSSSSSSSTSFQSRPYSHPSSTRSG